MSGSLFIESKLVEAGFGGCGVFVNGDCDGSNPAANFDSCYLHYIGRMYLTAMKEAGLFNGKLGSDTICPLVNHYQFYRELLLAYRKQGFYVLLGDERSPVFVNNGGTRQRGIWIHLLSMLPFQDLQALSRRQVPQAKGLIQRAYRNRPPAVGRDRDGSDPGRMPFQHLQTRAGRQVP